MLSGIDLLVACVIAPINVRLTLHHSRVISEVFWSIATCLVLLSVSTLLLYTLDCFLSLYFTHTYNPSKLALVCGFATAWLIPILLTSSKVVEIEENSGIPVASYLLACMAVITILYTAMVAILRNREAGPRRREHVRHIKTSLMIVVSSLIMLLLPSVAVTLSFIRVHTRALCAFAFLLMLAGSAVRPLVYCSRMRSLKRRVLCLLRMDNVVKDDHHHGDSDVVVDEHVVMESDGRTRDLTLFVIFRS